ncbi:putative 2OG-Fe(II) oxygenase [Erythrobacter sp. F6033]|uniref:2OG-Fe(II) oxygenase family protein n=1 Tax=Erythrobacter sp. F6033 TaxID=2926401 RepID=UPI001FF170C4|nr:putative 2OG-Fe(II) oxygenase [Erythrobacter sp. F6033]MCK0127573.1 putative 2OG-Fe(II) oxygenase [Erythrobacter sp. F6033]
MLNWLPGRPKPDIHTQIAALSRFQDRLPGRSDIRVKLAGLYLHLGEFGKAESVLGQKVCLDSPDALLCHARLARHRGRASIAEGHFYAAQALGSKVALAELGRLLVEQERYEEAVPLCREALATDPGDFVAAMALCRSLIALNQIDELGQWGGACLALGQWNALAPTALAHANQTELLEGIVSPKSSITSMTNIVDADTPGQLFEQLTEHTSRSKLPASNAGKGGGWRISHLLELGIPSVETLFERIKQGIRERALGFDAPTDWHPLHCVPENVGLETWANIFAGDGYEDWHCHPAGWLSGVFYVDVPVSEEGSSPDGQIEFGPLPISGQNDLEAWPKQLIMPQKGALLLFPSYFGHRTYPSQSSRPRISIAFDVVPKTGH